MDAPEQNGSSLFADRVAAFDQLLDQFKALVEEFQTAADLERKIEIVSQTRCMADTARALSASASISKNVTK